MFNFASNISKEDNIELFREYIGGLLLSVDNTLLKDLNDDLADLFIAQPFFKIDIEKALYQNIEIISDKKFILDNREQSASIKNWLNYFIKGNGSGQFDNVLLTKFIAESENTKLLNEEEKKKVTKLLKVYRNIKFFPQSMEGVPPEKWEIIPTEKKEEVNRATQIPHDKKSGREALLEELKGNIDDYAEGSLERDILAEESEKDREYHKLLLLAKKYPEGSLERRAVEEEMGRIGN